MLTAVFLAGISGYGGAAPPAQKDTPAAIKSQNTDTKEGQGQEVKKYSPKEREKYQQKVAADLEEIQNKMGELRAAKGATVPQQKKRMFRRGQIVFQQKLTAAKGRLAALEKASEKEWTGLKAEMDQALEELTNAYKEVESSLK
jgi:hypothetical protein